MIALAQQSVADSVNIAGVVLLRPGIGTAAGQRTVVAVRAANVSFTVRPSEKAAVWAALRSSRRETSDASATRVLRATTTGDTVSKLVLHWGPPFASPATTAEKFESKAYAARSRSRTRTEG
jgi:hypothetical protein